MLYSAARGTGWLGGVSYARNFFSAVSQEAVGIELVALVPGGIEEPPPSPGTTMIRCNLFNRRSPSRWLRLAVRGATGRDFLAEVFLHSNGIQALSHSGVLGINSRIPTINWIPDLQHKHFPDLFSPKQVRSRDKAFEGVCRSSTFVIASSECVRRDLESFFPAAQGRVRVLRFVDTSAAEAEVEAPASLGTRYQFTGPYFLVPNQFWAHKNHVVIIDALRILRSRGHRVQVLATGNTFDHRRPTYFRDLMQRRAEAGVDSEFRCLGIVPYRDVANLARGAVSLINPSLFEGWSTSVEEAKSLGKSILLSDIAVHREQAPERGAYFPPNDAEALADLMWREWTRFSPDHERLAAARAKQQLPGRRLAFAQTYASIIAEAIAGGGDQGKGGSETVSWASSRNLSPPG
jgi:glycosyltransferase involved in cell wall biosynthesis